MAKRRTTTYSTNYSIAHPLAFWGIIISGIASFISLIVKVLVKLDIITGAGSTVGTIISVMNLIANLALFACVFLMAYGYAMRRTKAWRILFWVFTILAFLGIIGVNVLGMFGV